jgi:tetratricopeptide (TPR) repeat protein
MASLSIALLMAALGRADPVPSGTASDPPHPPTGDTLSQGMWWLYQLQYDRARDHFSQYIQHHPKDPTGYFYKAATDWWELAQKLDYDLPAVEKQFEKNYEKTVEVARALEDSAPDDKTRAQACLYWGGAEGLWGRWLVTQKQWVKAYFMGKHGNNHLREALKYDPELYDAYLGVGIYDYFTDTLPGVQGVLADLLIHGDKDRGLRELKLAIDKAKHARVEAQMFMIEIYTSEENTPEKALPIAEALHKEYPQSPGMYLAEVSVLYTAKKWPEMMREAQRLLELAEQGTPYYTRDMIQPARYCLGVGALFGRHDPALAFAYMNQLLQNVDSSRWVTYAYLRRGQVYDLRGERDKALKDYQTVMDRPDFWGSRNEARQFIKQPFKY